jgi:hypothetical protein
MVNQGIQKGARRTNLLAMLLHFFQALYMNGMTTRQDRNIIRRLEQVLIFMK